MCTRLPLVTTFAASLLCAATARAEVSLFPLFSDHAVLLRSERVPVWGRAAPGEHVTVTLGDNAARATAVAASDGKWTATLDLRRSGEGPFDLVAAGVDSQVKSTDVLVGEVWLCSGQSNMEFGLGDAAGGKEETRSPNNPRLRQFGVTKVAADTPTDAVQGRWVIAGPATVSGFTAVGYYFAKGVQAATHLPVGLIHSSWGGTPIEAWTSVEGFAACPDPELRTSAEKARHEHVVSRKALADYQAWQVRYLRLDRAHDAPADYILPSSGDTGGGWTAVTLPAQLGAAGLPDAGASWLRRVVPVKQALPRDGHAYLYLGDPHGSLEVYWNGRKIEPGDFSRFPKIYPLGADDLKVGDNVLAVRIFEADHGAAIGSGKAPFLVELPEGKVALDGAWQARVEFSLPALAAGTEAAPTIPFPPRSRQETASYLYNGMIAPLVPYALRGVLWYQGEANAWRAAQYREAFPSLITDWRKHWGQTDLPFYWCQLANFQTRQERPDETGWAEVREAQTRALRLPNTGQAILIDLGEEADIHPRNKADVGARLARIALAKNYGQRTVVSSGPVFDALTMEAGGKVRLKFTHADGGLVATPIPPTYQPSSLQPETKLNVRHSPGGQLEGFVMCGEDHQWHWATSANIDGGNGVVLTCAEVPVPVAVRFAWASNPLCNLANGAGLLAGPFRTDDLPLTTAKERY